MSENKNNLRILFMGTPHFSAEILSALLDHKYGICAVFTQPDKKVGRKQILEKSPVKILAEKNNIPVFTPHRLDQEAIAKAKNLNPDLIILVAYGKILSQAFLDLPSRGAVNIHPSLLPKFRGPSPIQNALLEDEKITGTTIMLMDAGMDTGDILKQETVEISPNETYFELEEKLIQLSSRLLMEVLLELIDQKIVPQKQEGEKATYCKMIAKNDGQIDWHDPAEMIYNKYRAFAKWPGIFTFWNSKRLKLNKISPTSIETSAHQPGEIFEYTDGVCVQAGRGAIKIEEVQLESKPNMKISDFVNGQKKFIGSILD